MNDADREPSLVLTEMAPMLALLATRRLYDARPELWQLGERGRHHTLSDFGYHFQALTSLDSRAFASHVQYCVELFRKRSLPLEWLDYAWDTMEVVLKQELPPATAALALSTLSKGVEQVRPS